MRNAFLGTWRAARHDRAGPQEAVRYGRSDMTVSEFSAVVTDIRLESREGASVRWRMAPDRTEFAGGDVGVLRAVSRGGTRIEVPVLAVVADEAGDLWHVVEKPLAAGTDVVGQDEVNGDYCVAEAVCGCGARSGRSGWRSSSGRAGPR